MGNCKSKSASKVIVHAQHKNDVDPLHVEGQTQKLHKIKTNYRSGGEKRPVDKSMSTSITSDELSIDYCTTEESPQPQMKSLLGEIAEYLDDGDASTQVTDRPASISNNHQDRYSPQSTTKTPHDGSIVNISSSFSTVSPLPFESESVQYDNLSETHHSRELPINDTTKMFDDVQTSFVAENRMSSPDLVTIKELPMEGQQATQNQSLDESPENSIHSSNSKSSENNEAIPDEDESNSGIYSIDSMECDVLSWHGAEDYLETNDDNNEQMEDITTSKNENEILYSKDKNDPADEFERQEKLTVVSPIFPQPQQSDTTVVKKDIIETIPTFETDSDTFEEGNEDDIEDDQSRDTGEWTGSSSISDMVRLCDEEDSEVVITKESPLSSIYVHKSNLDDIDEEENFEDYESSTTPKSSNTTTSEKELLEKKKKDAHHCIPRTLKISDDHASNNVFSPLAAPTTKWMEKELFDETPQTSTKELKPSAFAEDEKIVEIEGTISSKSDRTLQTSTKELKASAFAEDEKIVEIEETNSSKPDTVDKPKTSREGDSVLLEKIPSSDAVSKSLVVTEEKSVSLTTEVATETVKAEEESIVDTKLLLEVQDDFRNTPSSIKIAKLAAQNEERSVALKTAITKLAKMKESSAYTSSHSSLPSLSEPSTPSSKSDSIEEPFLTPSSYKIPGIQVTERLPNMKKTDEILPSTSILSTVEQTSKKNANLISTFESNSVQAVPHSITAVKEEKSLLTGSSLVKLTDNALAEEEPYRALKVSSRASPSTPKSKEQPNSSSRVTSRTQTNISYRNSHTKSNSGAQRSSKMLSGMEYTGRGRQRSAIPTINSPAKSKRSMSPYSQSSRKSMIPSVFSPPLTPSSRRKIDIGSPISQGNNSSDSYSNRSRKPSIASQSSPPLSDHRNEMFRSPLLDHPTEMSRSPLIDRRNTMTSQNAAKLEVSDGMSVDTNSSTPLSAPWDEPANSEKKKKKTTPGTNTPSPGSYRKSIISSAHKQQVRDRQKKTQERIDEYRKSPKKCCDRWNPTLFRVKRPCARCYSLASTKEKAKFEANGRHNVITLTSGGCTKTCTMFPNHNDDGEGVSLCRICFHAVHRPAKVATEETCRSLVYI